MPRNARTSRNRVPLSRKGKSRNLLRGRGDYAQDIIDEPNVVTRIEKKLDHLERSLVRKAASTPIGQGASMAGRALGGLFGQGDLGSLAGEGLARLFGHGDYRTAIKGNSLMAGVSGSTVPKFQGDGKRGVRLTEREFIGNVVSGSLVSGSSIFDNKSFNLNPTDQNTFPWLSKIAELFDQWDPHGIVFEFHTTSSTFNGTSQALGAVIMATDYDVNDPPYSSKQQMENADYACSTVPSSSLLHGVECDPRERPLEVLYTTPRTGQLNFSSLGSFQIATQGCSTAGTTLGELWISYDITFYKKQLVSSTLDVATLSGSSNATAGGPLWIPSTLSIQRGITYAQNIGVGTTFSFPPSQGSGKYLLTVNDQSFQTGDIASITPTNLINCVQSQSTTSLSTVGSQYIAQYLLTLTGASASFRLGLRNVAPGVIILNLLEVDPNYSL